MLVPKLTKEMEVLRLGVSSKPRPVLSVEFTRGRRLLVWRVEFNPWKYPIAHLVKEMKRQFPKYLEKVSTGQLSKLLGNILRGQASQPKSHSKALMDEDLNKADDSTLNRVKEDMEEEYKRNSLTKSNPNFVYDLQVDFPTPRGGPF